jgi:hypothetical protein
MIGWFQSSSSARRNGGGPMRRRHRAIFHGMGSVCRYAFDDTIFSTRPCEASARIRHNIAQACQAQRRASEYLRTVGKPPNASEHQRRYVDRRDASKVLSRRPKRRPDKMRRFRRSGIPSSQALPSGSDRFLSFCRPTCEPDRRASDGRSGNLGRNRTRAFPVHPTVVRFRSLRPSS